MTYRTPRVHYSENELVNIQNGNVYSTLGPQGEPPRWLERVPVPVRRRRGSEFSDILPFPETPAVSPTRRPVVADLSEAEAVIPFPTKRPAAKSVPVPGRKAA
jgi:hypothetical protein